MKEFHTASEGFGAAQGSLRESVSSILENLRELLPDIRTNECGHVLWNVERI